MPFLTADFCFLINAKIKNNLDEVKYVFYVYECVCVCVYLNSVWSSTLLDDEAGLLQPFINAFTLHS